MNIHDTGEDTRTMKKVFSLAVKEVEAALGRTKPITDITRLAGNTLSSYSRIKSSEIHDKALEILLARKDLRAIPERV